MFVCSECGAPQPVEGRCAADGTPLTPIGEDLLLGTTIGAYRVARLLGVGGMGRVYKGVHPTIGSRVAIKVLSRECSDRRDLVERFFAEAKAVNLIRHESIVNVLDLAMLPDGRPYIIMEYLDGAPLASIVEHANQAQAPLPLGGLARLAVEVLDALSAAHAKHIVHRDLKPDNIFVTPSGRPKVLDFGIAKLNDLGAGSATRTGSLLGTPHYMSPEQAAGKSVDHRADVYAIGVILFECATGQKPFHAESLFDLLRKHVEVPPPPPSSLRPDLPRELESVILTALAKPPEQRFASAQAMSMALQHATSQLAPAHWTPITGSGTHRAVPTGGWQPTPPASWGSGARPRESVQPPQLEPHVPPHGPGAPPPIGHHSTVSASSGQVQRQRPEARSRKGLWLGLGALVLAGGGIAAAVSAGGGGGGDGGDGAAGASSAAAGDDPAASAEHARAGAPSPAPGTPPPGTPPAPEAAADDEDEAAGDPDTDRALVEAMKGLQGIDPRSLSPEARKRLADLKGLARLPSKERLDRIKQLAEGLDLTTGMAGLHEVLEAIEALDPGAAPAGGGGGGGGGGSARPARGAARAEAEDPAVPGAPAADGDPDADPDDDAAGAPGASASAPRAPGPWVAARPLAYPRFDAKRVDTSAFIRWAIAEAKRAAPDAVLFRVDATGVGPDGFANLELPTLASSHGSIALRFFSPARAAPNPKLPVGVPDRGGEACELRIEAEPDGVAIRPVRGFDCKRNVAVPAPRCTATGLWKLARAAKAPPNAVAALGYRAWSGRARWGFDIGFGHDVVFSQVFDDGC